MNKDDQAFLEVQRAEAREALTGMIKRQLIRFESAHADSWNNLIVVCSKLIDKLNDVQGLYDVIEGLEEVEHQFLVEGSEEAAFDVMNNMVLNVDQEYFSEPKKSRETKGLSENVEQKYSSDESDLDDSSIFEGIDYNVLSEYDSEPPKAVEAVQKSQEPKGVSYKEFLALLESRYLTTQKKDQANKVLQEFKKELDRINLQMMSGELMLRDDHLKLYDSLRQGFEDMDFIKEGLTLEDYGNMAEKLQSQIQALKKYTNPEYERSLAQDAINEYLELVEKVEGQVKKGNIRLGSNEKNINKNVPTQKALDTNDYLFHREVIDTMKSRFRELSTWLPISLLPSFIEKEEANKIVNTRLDQMKKLPEYSTDSKFKENVDRAEKKARHFIQNSGLGIQVKVIQKMLDEPTKQLAINIVNNRVKGLKAYVATFVNKPELENKIEGFNKKIDEASREAIKVIEKGTGEIDNEKINKILDIKSSDIKGLIKPSAKEVVQQAPALLREALRTKKSQILEGVPQRALKEAVKNVPIRVQKMLQSKSSIKEQNKAFEQITAMVKEMRKDAIGNNDLLGRIASAEKSAKEYVKDCKKGQIDSETISRILLSANITSSKSSKS